MFSAPVLDVGRIVYKPFLLLYSRIIGAKEGRGMKRFSAKRALGVTKAKRKISKATGIPLTKSGRKRKVQRSLWKILFGK
jgi:hypothetical protein